MNEAEKEAERRRRNSAGSAEIPAPQEGEVIRGLMTTETELRILSDFGIYRVLLPNDVDPDITASHVPWVLQKESKRGTRDPVVARTLGQLEAFKHNLFYDDSVQKVVTRHMVAAAKALSDCKDIIEEYRAAFESLPENVVVRAGPSAVALQTLDGYDRQCRSFFLFAKRVIIQCTEMLIESASLRSTPGNVTALLKEIDASTSNQFDLMKKVLRHHETWCKLVTNIRNCVEHPKPTQWLETRNCTLQPDGSIMRPTFCVHHPEVTPSALVDFDAQATALLEPMTAFCEETLVVVGLLKYDAPFPVEVGRLPEEDIDPVYPVRLRATVGPFKQPIE